MDTRVLRAAVDAAFVTTGASTPPWPDPHPEGAAPVEEEYSRCLDPTKYRITAARAEAWVQVLTGQGLALAEELPRPDDGWRDYQGPHLDRAQRLRPARPGALPLRLAYRDFDGTPDVTTIVGAGEPAALLTVLPPCGCDACDEGSGWLLEQLDQHVLAVVTGTVLHVTTPRGTVLATPSGWSAQGDFPGRRAIDDIIADARAGRSRHAVLRGLPWA